jgi:hypothetical protein
MDLKTLAVVAGFFILLMILYNKNILTGGAEDDVVDEDAKVNKQVPMTNMPELVQTFIPKQIPVSEPETVADTVSGANGDEMYAEFNHQDSLMNPQDAVNSLGQDKNNIDPKDLLPSYNNLKSDLLDDVNIDKLTDNFLTTKPETIIGVNTVGSSLRNANYSLRSEPANPQSMVSPWNVSTINPDLVRRPLEIGCNE